MNPNWFTTLSLILCMLASVYFARGSLRSAALLLMIGGLFDMIDGQVARASNRVTRFGALYDSTLDRFSEIFIFIGISIHIISTDVLPYLSLGIKASVLMLALSGSLMVSYVRARAESLDFECKKGLLQRPERFVLLILASLISGHMLIAVLVFLAVFTHITAVQRLIYVFQHENSRKWENIENPGHE
ncbi:MAG: CDP-alcohol phosphatidyltransferase family protein [candidate division KSB1 bacterium]|nr:CDP-alcohol phosphatidyltransferase family protein [candidate division KSB1 bacterium]